MATMSKTSTEGVVSPGFDFAHRPSSNRVEVYRPGALSPYDCECLVCSAHDHSSLALDPLVFSPDSIDPETRAFNAKLASLAGVRPV